VIVATRCKFLLCKKTVIIEKELMTRIRHVDCYWTGQKETPDGEAFEGFKLNSVQATAVL